MIQHSGGTSHGARNALRWSPYRAAPTASRLLLVGADLRWSRAVRAVARSAIDVVPSGQAALARLLDQQPPYTHVLLNPARADGLLTTILSMTCDEQGSGTELLLLGRAAAAPSHACVIPGPSHQAIRTALTEGCGTARPAPPSVAALRSALAHGRIDLRYQPLVHVRDRTPAGVEALARLHHVGHGLIAPDQFVPRIENAGLAAALTGVVAARSLADMVSPFLLAEGFRVGLNFPLDVFVMPEAQRRLDDRRQALGVAASRIVIELTESRAVADLPQLRRAVERLRRAGYHVAIDDVTPAMPHYAALLDMPFTTVKLDKDIVMRAAVAPDAADFVDRITAAAKTRGLRVIAEGVQDIRTWHRVRRAGADMAQGYIIGRPLPVAVLPAWLKTWRARTDLN